MSAFFAKYGRSVLRRWAGSPSFNTLVNQSVIAAPVSVTQSWECDIMPLNKQAAPPSWVRKMRYPITRKKKIALGRNPNEPITCSHCGGQAELMRRTLHPTIKGEIWTFECRACGEQIEMSKLLPNSHRKS